MKLSEFYTSHEFYHLIDGLHFPHISCKTENGELYIDEERNLFYKANLSKSSVLLCSDVGEWIYFNDNKIICTASDLDVPYNERYACIVDIHGNIISSGALTQFGLVYTQNDSVVKEDPNQNKKVILKLKNISSPVIFFDDSFAIPAYYPYSNFLYCMFYDYDGEFLEDKTKNSFLAMFKRDLIYSFVNCPISNTRLTEQQRNALSKFEEIRFDTSTVTFTTIDTIISLIEQENIVDKYAVRGYRKLKKLLISYEITDELVIPLLNIMVLNRSGEFGRRTIKFVSLVNAKRIELIAKNNKDNFKNIIYDIELIWENMKIISTQNS